MCGRVAVGWGLKLLACVYCVSRPLCSLGLKFKVSMCVRECMFMCRQANYISMEEEEDIKGSQATVT